MFDKLAGVLAGTLMPFIVLPIRSLSAYYVMNDYLQENKYSGISRFILTPVLGTVGFIFTFFRSIFCIPKDMYNCVKSGYEHGVMGVLSVPSHFTANMSQEVQTSRSILEITSVLFGGFLCHISVLQTASNAALLDRVHDNGKQAAERKEAWDNAQKKLMSEFKARKAENYKKALAEKEAAEKEKKQKEAERFEAGREDLIANAEAEKEKLRAAKEAEKNAKLDSTTWGMLTMLATERKEDERIETEKPIHQAQRQKNLDLYTKIAALSEEKPSEMPAISNKILADCKNAIETGNCPPDIAECYRYVTTPSLCPVSNGKPGDNGEGIITGLCYDENSELPVKIISYDCKALLEHALDHKDRTDPVLDCEELQQQGTMMLIRGPYADAAKHITQFVEKRQKAQETAEKEKKQALKNGRSKFIDNLNKSKEASTSATTTSTSAPRC